MKERIDMNEEMNAKLIEWCEKMSKYHIPRWNELPEIDIYMDQVVVLMEKYLAVFDDGENKPITPAIISNYVKNEYIPAPVKKKYSRTHLAYLMMICILKQVLPLPTIMSVIEYQTEKMSVENVYNQFCDEQEESLLATVGQVARLGNDDGLMESFVLRAAIAANSSKAITDKVMELHDLSAEAGE